MTRLRTCFAVQGGMKFLSHLDILKVMERTLRRAEIPVAFSQGFNPHPKIAFGPARPVALASTCEYFDVELTRPLDPEEFREKVQEYCPPGLIIKAAREIDSQSKALMAVLNCAWYRVSLVGPMPEAQTPDGLIEKLFAQKEIVVERHSPKGHKRYDIRPGIWQLFAAPTEVGLTVEMEVMIGSVGNVRPEEVIQALGFAKDQMVEITRTGLFTRKNDGETIPPM